MPKWTPKKVWNGEDVYIIGGGKSLEHFDWALLKDKRTIGCNDAFKLGIDICKVCIFGDIDWFRFWKDSLAKYKGTVFTNVPSLSKSVVPWLWTTIRPSSGLYADYIAWNSSTGAAAISLAVLLGAKKIYLLGFDMKLDKDGKNNWHVNNINKPNPEVFPKFISGMNFVKRDLTKFDGVEVFNVTDDSDLNVFPKISLKSFWSERKVA
jgi:hypothetical protein